MFQPDNIKIRNIIFAKASYLNIHNEEYVLSLINNIRELIDHISTEKKFHCYINPERDIPETSQQIHNISNEMVKNKPIFKDIIDEFLSFIKNDSIIIHNADFDLKFLNYELSLCGLNNLENNIIDTLSIARSKYPGSSVSLDSLCKRFDVDLNERKEKGHGALIDCYLLSEVYL